MNRVKLELLSDMLIEVDGESTGIGYFTILESTKDFNESYSDYKKYKGLTNEYLQKNNDCIKQLKDNVEKELEDILENRKQLTETLETWLKLHEDFDSEVLIFSDLGQGDIWKIQDMMADLFIRENKDYLEDVLFKVEKVSTSIKNMIEDNTTELYKYLIENGWNDLMKETTQEITIKNHRKYITNYHYNSFIGADDLINSNERLEDFGGVYD